MFNFFPMSQEAKIRKEIMDRAKLLADESIHKELLFQALQASNFSYMIFQDLTKAAGLTGRVEITLKDGTKITIVDTEAEARKSLEKQDQYVTGQPLY